jgi:hypothetical protein
MAEPRTANTERLVAYGESTGPPLRWPDGFGHRRGASVQGTDQCCDNDLYLEERTLYLDGLYCNVEGEAIGDFT